VHPNPKILGGTLVFTGTRVMAQTLLDDMTAGESVELFIAHFPSVKAIDAIEFLRLTHEEDPAR